MNKKLMTVLLSISAFLILLGAFFMLQHYPNGNSILWTGFILHFILSSFEIERLKKIIKGLQQHG
jgi:hypothetical protein